MKFSSLPGHRHYIKTACYYGYQNPWFSNLWFNHRFKRQVPSQNIIPPYKPSPCNPWFLPPLPQPAPTQSPAQPQWFVPQLQWQPPHKPNERPWFKEPECPPCECPTGCGQVMPQYDPDLHPNCGDPCGACEYSYDHCAGYDYNSFEPHVGQDQQENGEFFI